MGQVGNFGQKFPVYSMLISRVADPVFLHGSGSGFQISLDPDPDLVLKFSRSGSGSGFSQDSGKLQKGL